jgi:hypothetical protein
MIPVIRFSWETLAGAETVETVPEDWKRLAIEAVTMPGKTGQLEVIADGERIAERGGT